MSQETAWAALVAVVLVIVLLRHHRHVRRYPLRLTCRTCTGSGVITDTTLLGTTVKGPCPDCKGDAWTPRRRSGWT